MGTIKFLEQLVINSEEWQTAPFRFFGKNEVVPLNFAISGDTPSWQDIVVSGNGSLTLANAKADGLNYVKLFGACEQPPSESIIGTAYKYNTETEYTAGLLTERVQLLYAGSASYSPPYSRMENTDLSKSWEYTITNVKIIDNTAYYDIGWISISGENCYIETNSSGKITFVSNIGAPATNQYNLDPVLNTEYDFKISYNGSGTITLGYKLSTDDTWTTVITRQSGSITDDGTNRLTVGGSNSLVEANLNNVTFINDNVLKYGKQSVSIPTPTTPLDIVCNNGVLKLSPNLTNYGDSTWKDGYFTTNGSIGGANYEQGEMYCETYYPVSEGEQYTISLRYSGDTLPSNTWTCFAFYDSSKTFISRTANSSSIAANPKTYTTTIQSGTAYIRISIRTYKNSGNAVYNVQLEKGGSATTYIPYGVYADGTTETVTVKDSNDTVLGTATAEMLLQAEGIYSTAIDVKDTQDIISGTITHNMCAIALTGDEEVEANSVTTLDGSYSWRVTVPILHKTYNVNTNKMPYICTHFRTVRNYGTQDYYAGTTAGITAEDVIIFNIANISTAQGFKDWLKAQYNAGTPVICVYERKTPTTETVTTQPLTIQAGTNIVEITQGSIDNLPLEVSYKGTV